MSNTVYTSEQYKMLIDLSAMLSSLIWEKGNEIVSAELETKFNISDELLFIPSSFTTTNIITDDSATYKYPETVTAAGINIVTIDQERPSLYFKYISGNNLTYDVISTELKNSKRVNDPLAYAKHYEVSGNLYRLYMDFHTSELPITVNSVANAFDEHNRYAGAHVNLDSLVNYYNKTIINEKETALQQALLLSTQVLLTEIQKKYNEMVDLLNIHKDLTSEHKNLNQLNNYYLKTTVDQFVTDSINRLNEHNNNSSSHQYLINEINKDKTDLANFKAQYTDDHTGRQLSIHNQLLEKYKPQTYGPFITINADRQESAWQGMFICGKNKNLEGHLTISNQDIPEFNIAVKVGSGQGYITAKLLDSNHNVIKNITLLDSYGNTTLNTAYVNTPSQNNISHIVPNTEWVKQYVLDHTNAPPIGSIVWWFGYYRSETDNNIPPGWLLCDGREIDQSYSVLRSRVGTHTPNLMDRFVRGSTIANTYQEAGLPNIKGSFWGGLHDQGYGSEGCFTLSNFCRNGNDCADWNNPQCNFDASQGTTWTNGYYMSQAESPYGKSNTVTPKNVTGIPIIKASGVETTEVPAEMHKHVIDKSIHFSKEELNIPTRYVKSEYYTSDRTGGYLLWNNNLLEQWGRTKTTSDNNIQKCELYIPYRDNNYSIVATPAGSDLGDNNHQGIYIKENYKIENGYFYYKNNLIKGEYVMWHTRGFK